MRTRDELVWLDIMELGAEGRCVNGSITRLAPVEDECGKGLDGWGFVEVGNVEKSMLFRIYDGSHHWRDSR